jgi:predicted DsbA family dithiol-disulfide isomerase
VDQDVATAQGAGATGTPVFFVNGIMLSGAQPIDAFVRVIEQELERTVSTPGGSEGSK